MNKRTDKEIENLKLQWLADGTWDLETAEGFEAHHDELLEFRLLKEADWRREAEDRTIEKSKELDCSFKTAEYIECLEMRLERMSNRIDEIYSLSYR